MGGASAQLYKSLLCFLVLSNLPCSFIPTLWIIELWGIISDECHPVLDCQVKPLMEFDDYGFVIIIHHATSITVDVIFHPILGLAPIHPF